MISLPSQLSVKIFLSILTTVRSVRNRRLIFLSLWDLKDWRGLPLSKFFFKSFSRICCFDNSSPEEDRSIDCWRYPFKFSYKCYEFSATYLNCSVASLQTDVKKWNLCENLFHCELFCIFKFLTNAKKFMTQRH